MGPGWGGGWRRVLWIIQTAGPGVRDKVFLLVSLNQLGTLFVVSLQCILAAMGTEKSMKLSSYTHGPSGDSGQTRGWQG